MDFSSIEKAMYGDVENDEDLMAELLALEAEEKRNKRPVGPSHTKQMSSQPQVGMGRGSASSGPALTPKMLAEAMADIKEDDLLSDDDEIDDPELLDELSNLVGEEEQNIIAAQAGPSKVAVDPAMLRRLQQLSSDYKLAVNNAKDNPSKQRRLQRSLDKIGELTKKVESGKAVSEDEIPVTLYAKNVPSQNTDDKFATVPAAADPGVRVPTPSHTVQPPPIPPRRNTSLDNSTNSQAISSVEPSYSPSTTSNNVENSTKFTKEHAADSPTVPKIPTPTRSSPSLPGGASSGSRVINAETTKKLLTARREAYVNNAQLANSAGDKKAAFEFYTMAKQFDEAIAAVNSGQVTECNEDEIPPAPAPYKPEKKEPPPSMPSTILEALQQRMLKYKSMCEENRRENNDRKYRMNSRIVKQYEDAIRAHRTNKPVDLTELPCPPGYPPFPPSKAAANGVGAKVPVSASGRTAVPEKPSPPVKPRKVQQIGPFAPAGPAVADGGTQTRQKQQLQFLLKRQLQFKEAALVAKQKKDIALAKKYLLAAKGFDPMIEASRAGLPVDIRKAPIPPQAQTSQQALKPTLIPENAIDPSSVNEGSVTEVFATLERDLIRQIKICDEHKLAFTRLGDVTRVNLFESWSADSRRDLLVLRQLAKNGSSLPKIRYESRNFPTIEICPDVNEDHLELEIVRVLNAKLPSGSSSSRLLCFAPYWRGTTRRRRRTEVQRWQPSDGNIFVRYEFGFPHDSPQSGKTKIVAGTNSPDYNEKVLLGINRKSKQLVRIIKRNCLKLEVFQKGGFLRSDRLLGVAEPKLVSLESKARIHESIDLMEGRKPAGGKIEFKIRIREPLGENKLNVVKEKWLILVT